MYASERLEPFALSRSSLVCSMRPMSIRHSTVPVSLAILSTIVRITCIGMALYRHRRRHARYAGMGVSVLKMTTAPRRSF